MAEVNLDDVQSWIDQGRLDATKRITPRELILSGLVKGRVEGVKILARGSELLKQPIDVLVSRASAEAIAAIEAAGGKIVTRYYTRLAIMRLVKNQSVNTDKPLPLGKDKIEAAVKAGLGRAHFRLPDPTSRDDFEYYRDPAHRGYMSYMVARGQSPSLYFKVPGEQKITSEAKTTKKEEEETLW
ncbi:50S ribosomal subunit protein L15 [Moelleriella libera RCEF 2490]|uniref:50S ribosomal subunit protein L15 n=1 Tax=Moelleriella libera RCEF 2490 TaxID=1081109 RepID=A0A166PAL6_9HYPO|nr:50S ribosomal subunit protein L15 [Moelleriella libera RCEF 2490]